MVTKLRGLTTRRATKIICFLLVVLSAMSCAAGTFQMLLYFEQTNVSPEVIFMDIKGGRPFYNSHIYSVTGNANVLIHYESEEKILEGADIYWEDDGDGGAWLEGYQRSSWISQEENTPARREQLEQDMIGNELAEFRSAKAYLDELEGFYYYVRAGAQTYGNAEKDLEFFQSLPVHYVAENYTVISDSHTDILYTFGGDYELYAGFSEEVVSAQSLLAEQSRERYLQYFAVIGVSFALAATCLVILLCGAGRRYGDEDKIVHFLAIDRPYHDLSLCFVAGLSALIFCGVCALAETLYRYNSRFDDIIYWLLAGAASITALLVYWLMSAAKRIKDRSFWRHTFTFWFCVKLGAVLVWLFKKGRAALIWIFSRIWRGVKLLFRAVSGFFKGLWAGTRLTAKVAVIIAAASLALVTIAACAMNYSFGPMLILCFLLAASAAILLLRYAHRIQALVLGAREVSQGAYDKALAVDGGELGDIAGSINNISAGISTAVEERMKSERLKTELITNVSHDIRTPLTSIITYTDLLKNEGLNCERAPEYLDVLVVKSQRLKTLTDELFEAAKAASGSIEVNLEPLNLTQLIQQVFGEADERIRSSGLDFRMNLPESSWVMADGKLLWRVLENLLSNVFKYSLTGSRVYVEVAEDGGCMRFEIKNISREPMNADPAELTERFKRGDDSRAGEGSGLGLSIVQSFVDAQGGRFLLSLDGDLFKASVLLPKVLPAKRP